MSMRHQPISTEKKQVTEVNIMFINRLVPIQISNYKSNKFWNSSKYINIGLSSKPSFLKFIGKKKNHYDITKETQNICLDVCHRMQDRNGNQAMG